MTANITTVTRRYNEYKYQCHNKKEHFMKCMVILQTTICSPTAWHALYAHYYTVDVSRIQSTPTIELSSTPLVTIGTHSEMVNGSGSPTLPTWLTDILQGVRAPNTLSWSCWQDSVPSGVRKHAVCTSCVKLMLTAATSWHCIWLPDLTVNQSEGLTDTLTTDVLRKVVKGNSGSKLWLS